MINYLPFYLFRKYFFILLVSLVGVLGLIQNAAADGIPNYISFVNNTSLPIKVTASDGACWQPGKALSDSITLNPGLSQQYQAFYFLLGPKGTHPFKKNNCYDKEPLIPVPGNPAHASFSRVMFLAFTLNGHGYKVQVYREEDSSVAPNPHFSTYYTLGNKYNLFNISLSSKEVNNTEYHTLTINPVFHPVNKPTITVNNLTPGWLEPIYHVFVNSGTFSQAPADSSTSFNSSSTANLPFLFQPYTIQGLNQKGQWVTIGQLTEPDLFTTNSKNQVTLAHSQDFYFQNTDNYSAIEIVQRPFAGTPITSNPVYFDNSKNTTNKVVNINATDCKDSSGQYPQPALLLLGTNRNTTTENSFKDYVINNGMNQLPLNVSNVVDHNDCYQDLYFTDGGRLVTGYTNATNPNIEAIAAQPGPYVHDAPALPTNTFNNALSKVNQSKSATLLSSSVASQHLVYFSSTNNEAGEAATGLRACLAAKQAEDQLDCTGNASAITIYANPSPGFFNTYVITHPWPTSSFIGPFVAEEQENAPTNKVPVPIYPIAGSTYAPFYLQKPGYPALLGGAKQYGVIRLADSNNHPLPYFVEGNPNLVPIIPMSIANNGYLLQNTSSLLMAYNPNKPSDTIGWHFVAYVVDQYGNLITDFFQQPKI